MDTEFSPCQSPIKLCVYPRGTPPRNEQNSCGFPTFCINSTTRSPFCTPLTFRQGLTGFVGRGAPQGHLFRFAPRAPSPRRTMYGNLSVDRGGLSPKGTSAGRGRAALQQDRKPSGSACRGGRPCPPATPQHLVVVIFRNIWYNQPLLWSSISISLQRPPSFL